MKQLESIYRAGMLQTRRTLDDYSQPSQLIQPKSFNYYFTSRKTGKVIKPTKSIINTLRRHLTANSDTPIFAVYAWYKTSSEINQNPSGIWARDGYVHSAIDTHAYMIFDTDTFASREVLPGKMVGSVTASDRLDRKHALCLEPGAEFRSIYINSNLRFSRGASLTEQLDMTMNDIRLGISIIKTIMPQLEDECNANINAVLATGHTGNAVSVVYPVWRADKFRVITNVLKTRKITL